MCRGTQVDRKGWNGGGRIDDGLAGVELIVAAASVAGGDVQVIPFRTGGGGVEPDPAAVMVSERLGEPEDIDAAV